MYFHSQNSSLHYSHIPHVLPSHSIPLFHWTGGAPWGHSPNKPLTLSTLPPGQLLGSPAWSRCQSSCSFPQVTVPPSPPCPVVHTGDHLHLSCPVVPIGGHLYPPAPWYIQVATFTHPALWYGWWAAAQHSSQKGTGFCRHESPEPTPGFSSSLWPDLR